MVDDFQFPERNHDLEIARSVSTESILNVAQRLGIQSSELIPYGWNKAKVNEEAFQNANPQKEGRVILVTAMTPTPAGEGKTTTAIGLGDALNRIGQKAIICLREPSIGPCFGRKGGATGGGYAQVVPMEEINLHFTGDIHAIGAAHNLLAALVDNHIYWGNAFGIDSRRVLWHHVVDMNNRALRSVVSGLGGPANGVSRETRFDITVASEVMAILCLAVDKKDLTRRLGQIIVGYTSDNTPVRASNIGADGAMSVLLHDAMNPNLVQTLEGNPVFIHGGPFANIAHGCNSVRATQIARALAPYVVTEAGFGTDLGAEKFFDIKCRNSGIKPAAAVVVATIRALKMHGGVSKNNLHHENVAAVKKGLPNLRRHIQNLKHFGVPCVVALNVFPTDTDAELNAAYTDVKASTPVEFSRHWESGGAGAENLARHVVECAENDETQFAPLYSDDMPLWGKVWTIATKLYGADDIMADKKVRKQFRDLEKAGYGKFPVCIAKTQYSFSTDPNLLGAPTGHIVPIHEVRLFAGAEFIIVICGNIMMMPGLPRYPAATKMYLDSDGAICGVS